MGLGPLLPNFLSASPHIVRLPAFICGSAILSAAAMKTIECKKPILRYLPVRFNMIHSCCLNSHRYSVCTVNSVTFHLFLYIPWLCALHSGISVNLAKAGVVTCLSCSIWSSYLTPSSPSCFVFTAFTAVEEAHLRSLSAVQPPPASRCGDVGPAPSCRSCRTRQKGKPLKSALVDCLHRAWHAMALSDCVWWLWRILSFARFNEYFNDKPLKTASQRMLVICVKLFS